MSDRDLINALQRNLADADLERRRLEELVAAQRKRIDRLDCTAACGECKACLLFEAKETITQLKTRIAAVERANEAKRLALGGVIGACGDVWCGSNTLCAQCSIAHQALEAKAEGK